MKKGLTELVFLLDRSGSMQGLEADTIGGFNGMIEKQRKQEGEANVTTVLFDNSYEILHDHFPIDMVRPLTEDDYSVRGQTALMDAVGKTIHKLINIQKHLPEDARAEKVIFVITTDGMENASREYSYNQIKSLIERQKTEYGWEFLFLGANMDAVSEAARFGIAADRSVTFLNDGEGIDTACQAVTEALSDLRKAACTAEIDGSWKGSIEADVKLRGFRK